ncbi:MAG: threonine--tRNA ligase [Spirochaetes bacterium GWF1_49_6]|nr:MAG: threonine--tRNA ligase [Spirochaetes bacterium GWF1_49_6]
MPEIKIGSGKLDVQDGKRIIDVLKELKENRAAAKEFGVSGDLDEAIIAEYNGVMRDLSAPLDEEGYVRFLTPRTIEGLDTLRHSASHIMAMAGMRLFPGAKLGIGPTIKDGFYYDMDIPGTVVDEDLARIEEEMQKIIDENLPVVRKDISYDEAKKMFAKMGQDYKIELIEELKAQNITLYTQGDFTDLCRGPHIPSTRHLKAFKLLSVAGAYWRGSEKNKMLTRIYGTAFADKKELKEHLELIEELKKRDHRKLGKELDLFSFHEEAPGMPFWLPNGVIMKNILVEFMRGKLNELNYIEIQTPLILKDTLWTRSGHMDKYKENMFFTGTVEGESLAIKPMSCPGGFLVYRETKHSYRELPLKVAEFGIVHRYERSGNLHGLFRVRGFTQDDAHIFMTPDQIEGQIIELIKLIDEVYSAFGFQYKLELSTRPEMSVGSDEMWENSTEALRQALVKSGREFKINDGDGAFYGPKIDFHLEDALGRTHQCGTIQLDMNLTERFDLNYTAADGQEHRVVMLHRAIYGSLERFIGILIEHLAGKFPVWISPVQATILPVSDKFNDYAAKVLDELKNAGIRAEADYSSEKLGYKIRQATLKKVPYMLIVGEKEVEGGNISVRGRDKGDLGASGISEFIKNILDENQKRL